MDIRKQGGAMLAGLLTMATMLAGCAGLHEDTTGTSPEMAAILKDRAITKWELSTAGLKAATPAESVQRAGELEHNSGLEVLALPPKPGAMDASSYMIYLDHQSGEYWVVQHGGPGGSAMVYGPGKVEK